MVADECWAGGDGSGLCLVGLLHFSLAAWLLLPGFFLLLDLLSPLVLGDGAGLACLLPCACLLPGCAGGDLGEELEGLACAGCLTALLCAG